MKSAILEALKSLKRYVYSEKRGAPACVPGAFQVNSMPWGGRNRYVYSEIYDYEVTKTTQTLPIW